MVSTSSSMPCRVSAEMHSADGILLLQPAPLVGRQRVALVVDLEHRHVDRADLVEHAAHGVHPAIAVGRRRVDDVQHQVGVGDFLERGAKRRDQRVRQPIDEADGVGHQQLAAVGQPHLPHQRIERHEQRVRTLRRRRASAR